MRPCGGAFLTLDAPNGTFEIGGVRHASLGILMDARVTAFPFNVMNNPMYNGATMLFAATSIQYQSAAGLVLTVVAYIVYQLALFLEQYVELREVFLLLLW
jgi:Phospholipid methyltransferase